MEFDDKKGLMIFNEDDFDYILKQYIRTYRYFKDNKLPKKIIIQSIRDYIELTEDSWREVQGKKIPYTFGGFGDSPKKRGK